MQTFTIAVLQSEECENRLHSKHARRIQMMINYCEEFGIWGNSEKVFNKFFKQSQWKSSTHNTEKVKSWGIRTRFLVKTVVDDPVPTDVTVVHLVWSGLVLKPMDTQSRDTQSLLWSPWAKNTQSSPKTRGKSSGQTSKPSQTWSPNDPQVTTGLL